MLAPKHILVVDDDAAMISLLRDFLGRQGYVVATSTSAAGALSFINQITAGKGPDLVLSDVKLGTTTGIELARQLAAERPLLPIVLFSVFEEHEKEALKSGARCFLRKPFSLSVLAKILADELSR